MWNFQFNNTEPIYLQIINLVKRNIAIGYLRAGDKLPSVREMASLLEVNPNTLHRAYSELEKEGITFTKRGMGSFVSEEVGDFTSLKNEMGEELAIKFLNDMKDLGITKEETIKIIENLEG
ncbi:GntR family transcriptional regulator [Clostridium tarantellae]|uniref:GntR family transcriptional regulator n=1 Tax=Clostridium tarantellae TaxID=39493 RepID=A0A6I1MS65_9CLOT|nr:GntR family transcriptional regulator [Clostridium tarantellae]